MYPQVPGRRSAGDRVQATGGPAGTGRNRQGSLRPLLAALSSRPLVGLAARGACLIVSLLAAVRYPTLIIVAAAVWLWVLWPAYAVRRTQHPPRTATRRPAGAGRRLDLRYLGGHPLLPRAGRAVLRVWEEDGGAVLRVGRRQVAFALDAVRGVSLLEGREEVATSYRGIPARLIGRWLARGNARLCGWRRGAHGDVALLDRSRVVCDLARAGHSVRLVLTARAGGGEAIYLETLVLLRPANCRADGGARGTASSPQGG